MENKGFQFSQNLMDELGSYRMECSVNSSEESWTNSQFSESKVCGYQVGSITFNLLIHTDQL